MQVSFYKGTELYQNYGYQGTSASLFGGLWAATLILIP